jgi:hypothetical protein
MSRRQVRLSLDEALWDAVQAAAKVHGVAPHLYVEEALRTALGPSESMHKAAEIAENVRAQAVEMMASAAEMRDQVRVIADYIVDLYRATEPRESHAN